MGNLFSSNPEESRIVVPKKFDTETCPELGRGTFGIVYLLQTSECDFAVKSITMLAKDVSEEVQREFDLMKALGDSKHFVKVYELRIEPNRFLIFMEYMPGGTLRDLIKESPDGRLPELEVTNLTRQLLQGVEFMHARNIMNRDIKTENVLLDHTQEYLKISDFSVGKKLATERTCTDLQTQCGTVLYMAPELIQGHYGRKAEIWSVGIIAIEMLMGHHPYHQLESFQYMFVIGNNKFKYDMPDDTSKDMGNLVAQLLSLDPDKRPSASKALQHEVLKRYIGQHYTGEELFCSDDDLDEIIKTALDNKLHIYAVVPMSEYVNGEYRNTNIYYIPHLKKVVVVNDQRLSERLFRVVQIMSASTSKTFYINDHNIVVAGNAINSFITMAKQGDYFSKDARLCVDVIISQSDSNAFTDLPYSVANGDRKVKIFDLYFHIKDNLDPLSLTGLFKHIAVNGEVTGRLSFTSSPSQPIANLCEAIRDVDDGLQWLKLFTIDLSSEQRLANTLKCTKGLNDLRLYNTGINADALVQIGHKLKHKLWWLSINNEPCLQSAETCGRFFNAIKGSSEMLSLYLTDNKLNASHLSALPDILPTMKGSNFELHLDNFEASNDFMQKLRDVVGSKIASKVVVQGVSKRRYNFKQSVAGGSTEIERVKKSLGYPIWY